MYTQVCCFRARISTPASKFRSFTRYCADFGPKCARQRVNFADLLASVLDFREKPHTSVHTWVFKPGSHCLCFGENQHAFEHSISERTKSGDKIAIRYGQKRIENDRSCLFPEVILTSSRKEAHVNGMAYRHQNGDQLYRGQP